VPWLEGIEGADELVIRWLPDLGLSLRATVGCVLGGVETGGNVLTATVIPLILGVLLRAGICSGERPLPSGQVLIVVRPCAFLVVSCAAPPPCSLQPGWIA
jgi:hypothetical protein